jgi:hypothetical protein
MKNLNSIKLKKKPSKTWIEFEKKKSLRIVMFFFSMDSMKIKAYKREIKR